MAHLKFDGKIATVTSERWTDDDDESSSRSSIMSRNGDGGYYPDSSQSSAFDFRPPASASVKIGFPATLFRDTSELLEAFAAMSPAESERAYSLLEAMVARRGVREAAIAFLEVRGVSDAPLVADRILNDAEGVA